jgi:hypothetical protein
MKTFNLRKNWNLKLGSPGIVHVMPAAIDVLEFKKDAVYRIASKDDRLNAHSYKLVRINKLKLENVTTVMTVASHGQPKQKFIERFINDHPGATTETKVIVLSFISKALSP